MLKNCPFLPRLPDKTLREIIRHIRAWRFEFTEHGILIPSMNLGWGGVHTLRHNGRIIAQAENLLTTQGRNHILDVVLHAGTQVTTWYMAPYSNATDPLITWTAANFDSNANEETNYTQASRPEWDETAASAGVITTTARGTITADTGGIAAMNGTGLLSSSTKGGTSGTLLSATRYAAAVALPEGDSYDLGYQATLIDTSEA